MCNQKNIAQIFFFFFFLPCLYLSCDSSLRVWVRILRFKVLSFEFKLGLRVISYEFKIYEFKFRILRLRFKVKELSKSRVNENEMKNFIEMQLNNLIKIINNVMEKMYKIISL